MNGIADEFTNLKIKLRTMNTFADLYGQERAIASLRRFVTRQAITRGLILHGPDGVGKRTLARVFARAILCQNVGEEGNACGACEACLSGSFGVTEFDGRGVTDHQFEQLALEEPKSNSLLGRQVVIIDGADQMSSFRFDRILKTLEEPKSKTIFILLATEISRVRRAGRSRCFSQHLRPLTDPHTRRLVLDLMMLNALEPSLTAVDLAVAVARGLPMQLTRAVDVLSDCDLEDHRAMKAALELDWPAEFAGHWRDILQNGGPIEALLGAPAGLQITGDRALAKWSERGRLFLLHMQTRIRHGNGFGGLDPALDVMDEADLNNLAKAWRTRFSGRPGEEEPAWRHLTAVAASDDYCIPGGAGCA